MAAAHNSLLGRIDAAYGQVLPPAQKAVLVVLARHSDAAGRCRPGVERMSTLTGYDDRTVRRALAALDDRNLIVLGPRHRRPNGTLSGRDYQLHLAALGFDPPDIMTAGPPDTVTTGTSGHSVPQPPVTMSAQEGVTREEENPRTRADDQSQPATPPGPSPGMLRTKAAHYRRTGRQPQADELDGEADRLEAQPQHAAAS